MHLKSHNYILHICYSNILFVGIELTNSQQFSDQQIPSSGKPPPLPPKQGYPKVTHQPKNNPSSYDNHSLNRFRDRAATSHIVRSTPTTPRQTNGNAGAGFRGRLSSDGSAQLSLSPPNTPPPPYSKYDHNQTHHYHHSHHTFHNGHQPPPLPPHHSSSAASSRHFSLSQQPDASHPGYSTHIQRTRSHGNAPYRRLHIPHSNDVDGGEGVVTKGGEGGGGGGERVISTPEVFAEVDGGTLV